jgi:hypothetical protein
VTLILSLVMFKVRKYSFQIFFLLRQMMILKHKTFKPVMTGNPRGWL